MRQDLFAALYKNSAGETRAEGSIAIVSFYQQLYSARVGTQYTKGRFRVKGLGEVCAGIRKTNVMTVTYALSVDHLGFNLS